MAAGKRNKNVVPTYATLQQQIADLQKQAEGLRDAEVAGVIERIREAIAVYGLTPDDLFGAAPARKAKRARVAPVDAAAPEKAPVAKKASAAKKVSVPKYRDPATGKTWSGVGKRPQWFVAAVEGGADPQTLAV